MNENIYLCSFCDSTLTPSAKRLKMQAREFGIFKDIFLYNRNKKYQIAGSVEINNEELCPCYSGKKYKDCHGKKYLSNGV